MLYIKLVNFFCINLGEGEMMPKYISIEMKAHIDTICTPLVKVGDSVDKGQLIAKSDTTNIHSSVYGEVVELDHKIIKILKDHEQPKEYVKIKDTASNLEAIKEAGIVGAGGGGFPTHIKLNVNLQGGCVIMNAAECEPVLGHNIRVVEDMADTLIRGIRYVMGITNANRGYIAIKALHTRAIAAIVEACKGEADIEIKYLSDRYPSGDERVVVREVLGTCLEPGQLPIEACTVVLNVETIKRIVEAIELRKPVISKDFTIGGRLVGTQGGSNRIYLDQPIGTPIKDYIDECGGYLHPHVEIVLGGPFMGSGSSEEAVINKTLGGIFVAMPFPVDFRNFGILACECGASEDRLIEIVTGMGGNVVAQSKCKRMIDVGGRYRCDEPGNCPGQAESVLRLKAEGAEAIVIGTCED